MILNGHFSAIRKARFPADNKKMIINYPFSFINGSAFMKDLRVFYDHSTKSIIRIYRKDDQRI